MVSVVASTADGAPLIKNEFTAFGFPESFAEVALKNGKLLILLDGIDEVPSDNLNHVVNDIRRFVENNSSNRFIISSRTEFYQNWFSRFTDISVAEFRSDQIRSFLKNWFQVHNAKEKGKAKKFWEMLTWPKNKTFLELAGRPNCANPNALFRRCFPTFGERGVQAQDVNAIIGKGWLGRTIPKKPQSLLQRYQTIEGRNKWLIGGTNRNPTSFI